MVDLSIKIDSFLNIITNYLNNINNVEKKEISTAFINYIDNNPISSNNFLNEVEIIKKELEKDLEFFIESDPAVDSMEEIILTYPGYKAITYYRIAHILRKMGYLLISRMISENAHTLTGIDIHPAATISTPFFIDHGTGIVIGETCEIGKRVKIYQGVTLGALSLSKGKLLKGTKRHPTIGDDVTIYAGVSILGNVNIGNDVTIGSNVFLTKDITSHTKVSIGDPILILKQK